jgi:hypothetical protein
VVVVVVVVVVVMVEVEALKGVELAQSSQQQHQQSL